MQHQAPRVWSGAFSCPKPYAAARVKPNYDIIAIDLDGTLLDGKGRVSDANLAAIHAARAAGLRTLICTGRGLAECRHITAAISQTDPVVVAGGSIIADPVRGHTLKRFPVRLDMVHDTVARLNAMRHAALVLKDPSEAGYDYLVVHGKERHPLDPVTKWWFDTMSIKVRYLDDIAHDEHPEHTVRVGACGLSNHLAPLRADLLAAAKGRAQVHSFPAVVAPEHASRLADGQSLHILELFDADATKWSAVSHLASQWGVPAGRIAAIGDEVNDESMIRGAGLGIAMGNAVPVIKDAARRHTRRHDEDGVSHAIHHILAGEW
ncbi:MAG: HAD hydrolase family protein [Tepidisphaera sp.]|nr:HAD hydrolase family protein [Tepidisphaera sp.]